MAAKPVRRKTLKKLHTALNVAVSVLDFSVHRMARAMATRFGLVGSCSRATQDAFGHH